MSKVRVVRSTVQRFISVHRARFLALPAALIAIVSLVAFRGTPMHSTSGVNPLVLPAGWPMPMVPAANPITQEKFVLGRQLFYETALSGDGKTSCATCHNSYKSFAAGGTYAPSPYEPCLRYHSDLGRAHSHARRAGDDRHPEKRRPLRRYGSFVRRTPK